MARKKIIKRERHLFIQCSKLLSEIDQKPQCPMEGHWLPCLILYPPDGHDSSPFQLIMNVPICSFHKDRMTVDGFLSDEGWQQIEQTFLEANHILPCRDTAHLDWVLNTTI